jgi:hypothetical protein
MVPDKHQLLALDSFGTPWLGELLVDNQNHPKYERDTVIIADEGGMGKTYSAVIVALRYLNDFGGSVIVLCPPLQKKQWFDAFKETGINVIATSARCLSDSSFPEGVTIISKFSPMTYSKGYDLTPDALQKLSDSVQLCILDEGHEGMLTNDPVAPLRDSIKEVLLSCKRRLIATATPIQKDWDEMVRLMQVISRDAGDVQRLSDFVTRSNLSDWADFLGDNWLPAINRLNDGQLTQQDSQMLGSNIGRMSPLLSPAEATDLSSSLPGYALRASQGRPEERSRLARDLHPFGKYMSIALRDDLGAGTCSLLYRQKESRVLTFDDWPELTDSITASAKYLRKGSELILRSCPSNALDDRYASFDPAVKDDEPVVDSLRRASQRDPRLDILKEICDQVRADHQGSGKHAGVVVFCQYRGTISFLEAWANSQSLDVHTLVGLDYNQQSTMSNNATNNHRSQQRKTLYRARKGAKDTSKTTILICGPGATVGLDMEWATHAVHWDVRFGNVETISQKSWRLDRRWNGSNDIFYRFKVTFLLNSNELTRAYRANDIHRQNRVVLGDRRYLPGGPGQTLFPTPSQFVSELWSQNGRGTHLTNYEARWIWDWIQSNVTDLSGLAEALGLKSLQSSVGLDLDLMDPTDKIVTDNKGIVGLSHSQLHDLMSMASPEERASLQFLAGGYLLDRNISTTFGPPGSNLPTLGILPDGQLSITISDHLSSLWLDQDPYPFVFRDSDLENPLKIAAHLGVLRILSSPVGPTVRSLWQDECPSGLIVMEQTPSGTSWGHVLVGGIDRFQDLAESMFHFGNEDITPLDTPPDNSTQVDRQAFLSMAPIQQVFDWMDIATRFPQRISQVGGILELQLHLSGLSQNPSPDDFIPIAHLFNRTTDLGPSNETWEPNFEDIGWC